VKKKRFRKKKKKERRPRNFPAPEKKKDASWRTAWARMVYIAEEGGKKKSGIKRKKEKKTAANCFDAEGQGVEAKLVVAKEEGKEKKEANRSVMIFLTEGRKKSCELQLKGRTSTSYRLHREGVLPMCHLSQKKEGIGNNGDFPVKRKRGGATRKGKKSHPYLTVEEVTPQYHHLSWERGHLA